MYSDKEAQQHPSTIERESESETEREDLDVQLDARKVQERQINKIKHDRSMKGREGWRGEECICTGKPVCEPRRGLEGEWKSERDADDGRGGPRVARYQSEGGKRRGKRERERENTTCYRNGNGSLFSRRAFRGGSVRNGPSTMPTHHGYTTMTIAAECGGRPWSP